MRAALAAAIGFAAGVVIGHVTTIIIAITQFGDTDEDWDFDPEPDPGPPRLPSIWGDTEDWTLPAVSAGWDVFL